MKHPIKSRSNEEWLAALANSDAASRSAIEELGGYLTRNLRQVLRGARPSEDDLEDFTQAALLDLVTHAHTFRGDSAFTTWAVAVATRSAFTELRRRRVRDSGKLDFERARADVQELSEGLEAAPTDEIASKRQLLAALERAIATRLSERQRTAILAELRGVPSVEVARLMGTNQNALYKLVHDARKNLRAALVSEGYSAEAIHAGTTAGEHA